MLSYCAPVANALAAGNGASVSATLEVGQCMGYFGALLQVSSVLGYCTPHGISTEQMIAVFSAYERAHPEQHHIDAIWEAVSAFTQAFPCN